LGRPSVASFMAVEEFSQVFRLRSCFCKEHGTRLEQGWSARPKEMPRLRNVQDWHDSVRKVRRFLRMNSVSATFVVECYDCMFSCDCCEDSTQDSCYHCEGCKRSLCLQCKMKLRTSTECDRYCDALSSSSAKCARRHS
jgi:hypothetical protein